MLSNYLSKVNGRVKMAGMLGGKSIYAYGKGRGSLISSCINKGKTNCTCGKCLSSKNTISTISNHPKPHLITPLHYPFTTTTLHHTHYLTPPATFPQTPAPTFISQHYQTITLDLEQKLQKIESLLHSPQRNLFKIVEEMIIVLEAFHQVNRRELMQENVVKVIRQFNKKLVGACLQMLQSSQTDGSSRTSRQRLTRSQVSVQQQTDATYQLHQTYPTSHQTLSPNPTPHPTPEFILYYLQTTKNWLITHIQTQHVITAGLKEIEDFINAREVSTIRVMLQEMIDGLVQGYVCEQDMVKREGFEWERKLRGLAMVQWMAKDKFEQYISTLADDNLIMYLKQSQLVNLMYDIITLQPNLTNTQFLYQIQSTRTYQSLFSLNASYIKSQFINYSRKFMVSYQQIQFYQLFKDLQIKMKYPTIRTFIRLTKILKTQADDLHCEYNKVMNKYNYNILISIITSQQYSIENTRLEELLELFASLNQLEKSGEILYDQVTRYLKNYMVSASGKQENSVVVPKLTQAQFQQVYALFEHILQQTTPVFKYQEKEGLNREFGKKTTYLVNVLVDLLIQRYPQVVVKARMFMRNYLMMEEMPSVFPLPCDDRVVCVGTQYTKDLEHRIIKLQTAWSKYTSTLPLSLTPPQITQLLQSILTYAKIQVHLVLHQDSPIETLIQSQDQPTLQTQTKLPQKFILLDTITTQDQVMRKVLVPMVKSFVEGGDKGELSKKARKQLYQSMYKILECMNVFKDQGMVSKELAALSIMVEGKRFAFVEGLIVNLVALMKHRLSEAELIQERKRNQGIQFLQMSLPGYDNELLLCLGQLLQLSKSTQPHLTTQSHLSSSHSTATPTLTPHLPTIYTFINKLAIRSLKSLGQRELIHTLMLFRSLEQLKSQNPNNVLLLQINTQIYQYLYQSLSVYVMYLADRGKYYLKLNGQNLEWFMWVVEDFVSMRDRFKRLESKKRLVILQAILVVLVKKKAFKLSTPHLKRSQHASILLAFLDIFQHPDNLTPDFKKIIQQLQFMSGDLQQFQTQTLGRFSQMNLSITRYLQDSKVNLTSSKQLNRLTAEQLRQQFAQGRSSMIYEMILRNSKYQLPFELPEPKTNDPTAKLAYIIQLIYQKISKATSYGVPSSASSGKASRANSRKLQGESSKRRDSRNNRGKQATEQQVFGASQQFFVTQQNLASQGSSSTPVQSQSSSTTNPTLTSTFSLQPQKSYIRRHSLVNYQYQDHYKTPTTHLPLHYRKQTWKNISTVPKQLQIQSLQIDQKIDQQIYKQILLALLGYTQKVKLVAKQFHSHNFIQYVAAQLDMQVMFHGCIARVTRKNKLQDNVLLVCAGDNSFKLLYVCTHILRESGENAYIVGDKIKEADFKQFLERLLPQPFEPDQEEIVDKVCKGEIGVGEEENGDSSVVREDQ